MRIENGMTMNITNLMTPAFLVDLPKLKANIQNMQARARRHGVGLRPHVKTHKTAEIARMQTLQEASGITVSTLAEARFYQKSGFDDITYAFPITLSKLAEAAELTALTKHFHILVDQLETLTTVEAYGRENGLRFSVFLKIDCGYHRAGVNPSAAESIQLAKQMHASQHITFRGILTHAGHSYHCRNPEEIIMIARQERDVMVEFADRLKQHGLACETISVGSTPTAIHAPGWQGISEIRPGNYAFLTSFKLILDHVPLRRRPQLY